MPRLSSLHILLIVSASFPWLTRFSGLMTCGSIAYPMDEKKKVTLIIVHSLIEIKQIYSCNLLMMVSCSEDGHAAILNV